MKLNILNKSYGSLTVVELIGSRNYSQYWKCRCACGNIVEKSTENLQCSRTKKHCGCQDSNLIGKVFGKLTVINQTVTYRKSGAQSHKKIKSWECQCECGSIVIRTTGALFRRSANICKCPKEWHGKTLIGYTTDTFTVVGIGSRTTKKYKYWECRCKCGNIFQAEGSALRSGFQKTCGCGKQDYFKAYRVKKGFPADEPMLPNRAYLRSLAKNSKKKLLERDNHKCVLCLSTENLDDHHIIPISNDDKLYKDYSNRIILCKTCHHVHAHGSNWQTIDSSIQKVLKMIIFFNEKIE